MTILNEEINYFMENYKEIDILHNLFPLIKLAAESPKYKSKQNNVVFEKIISNLSGPFYKNLSIEEANKFLCDLNFIHVKKGTELLDAFVRKNLIAKADEYRLKPYVLRLYLQGILFKEKPSKELIYSNLEVIETFFDVMMADEEGCNKYLRAALYRI
jgi:hypothetical protein